MRGNLLSVEDGERGRLDLVGGLDVYEASRAARQPTREASQDHAGRENRPGTATTPRSASNIASRRARRSAPSFSTAPPFTFKSNHSGRDGFLRSHRPAQGTQLPRQCAEDRCPGRQRLRSATGPRPHSGRQKAIVGGQEETLGREKT